MPVNCTVEVLKRGNTSSIVAEYIFVEISIEAQTKKEKVTEKYIVWTVLLACFIS